MGEGRGSYTEQEILGIHEKTPFIKRFNYNRLGQCELQCKEGYWSNYRSSYNTASEMNDQRCTYDNCKNWNYSDVTSNPLPTAKTCTTCWTKDDIESATWEAKKAYGKITGWDLTEPFKLSTDTNVCEVQCDSDHWSNVSAGSFNEAANALEQRCTGINCKSWDYANELENSIVTF